VLPLPARLAACGFGAGLLSGFQRGGVDGGRRDGEEVGLGAFSGGSRGPRSDSYGLDPVRSAIARPLDGRASTPTPDLDGCSTITDQGKTEADQYLIGAVARRVTGRVGFSLPRQLQRSCPAGENTTRWRQGPANRPANALKVVLGALRSLSGNQELIGPSWTMKRKDLMIDGSSMAASPNAFGNLLKSIGRFRHGGITGLPSAALSDLQRLGSVRTTMIGARFGTMHDMGGVGRQAYGAFDRPLGKCRAARLGCTGL